MSRIFSALALFAVFLLLSNIVVGFYLGDLGESSRRYEVARGAHHELESVISGHANVAGRRRPNRGAYHELESVIPASPRELQEALAEKDRRLAELSDMRLSLRPHVWLGIVAALVTVLVNCISVTYFIGTSRWCREVVDAYGLSGSLAERSRRLKRRSFPFAFLGMMTMLGIVALGAASDPGASLASPASWVLIHLLAALAGTVVIAAAFYVQVAAVEANFALIRQIVDEAERVRNRSHEVEPQPTSVA